MGWAQLQFFVILVRVVVSKSYPAARRIFDSGATPAWWNCKCSFVSCSSDSFVSVARGGEIVGTVGFGVAAWYIVLFSAAL